MSKTLIRLIRLLFKYFERHIAGLLSADTPLRFGRRPTKRTLGEDFGAAIEEVSRAASEMTISFSETTSIFSPSRLSNSLAISVIVSLGFVG
jgi:hypothetical protein